MRHRINFKNFLLIFGILLFYGAFIIFSSYVYYAGSAESFNWSERLIRLPSYLLWAFFIPFFYPFLLKNKIEKPNQLKILLKIISVGIVIALIHRILTTIITDILSGLFFNTAINLYESLIDEKFFVLAYAFDSFIMLAVISAVIYAVDYYRQANENKIKASRFQTELAKAELNSLKMQIHPHFLFNTLNSISVLIRKDPDAAEEMLVQLSGLLRASLDNAGRQFADLQTELDFIDKYIGIQKMRFKKRLIFEKNISKDALTFKLPYLLIQPAIENSIKHVLEKEKSECVIRMSAHVEKDILILHISDNGPGVIPVEDAFSKGFGLKSIKSRLKYLYGDDHEFKIFNENGLNVLIKLPEKNEYN